MRRQRDEEPDKEVAEGTRRKFGAFSRIINVDTSDELLRECVPQHGISQSTNTKLFVDIAVSAIPFCLAKS